MASSPLLPIARGPFSAAVIDRLAGRSHAGSLPDRTLDDPLVDDDLQLALWCCYALHYDSFAHVDPSLEWDPELLRVRRDLEWHFFTRLLDVVGTPTATPAAVRDQLLALTRADGPSLSRYIAECGTEDQLREFLIHRSAYQRKEADPHTWMIPRLRGRAKAAVVAIQHDEYGAGVAAAMHAELFATTMVHFNLDPSVGAYTDLLPGPTLATDNLVSMFGLHRALRGACVGHLALFEMTSVGPMGRYSDALRRFGAPGRARAFYDVHVEADAVHERIALDEMVTSMVEDEPELASQIVFGAQALTLVEQRFAHHLLDAWGADTTSLRPPLDLRPEPIPVEYCFVA